jgi:hypothetical protein
MDSIKDRLSRSRQINLSVTGRKSGKAITKPVWFVADNDKLYLLPVHGSDTQWYKNVVTRAELKLLKKEGLIRIVDKLHRWQCSYRHTEASGAMIAFGPHSKCPPAPPPTV